MGSRLLSSSMAEAHLSIAFTTYQTGDMFLVGLKQDGRLSIFERTYNRCMELCAAETGIYMSSIYQPWRFENSLPIDIIHNGFDRIYVLVIGHSIRDLDIQDIALDGEGRVIFVNTLFSAISTLDERASFAPVWQPNFLSRLAAEDRCHKTDPVMNYGTSRFVTIVAHTHVADGWRDHRREGDYVIVVETIEIVAHSLSMPHLPRLYRDKLWLHNTGTGELGTVETDSVRFEPMAFAPGRLSKPRDNKTFSGLLLEERPEEKNAEAKCSLQIVNLSIGDIVNWVKIEGVVEELCNVVTFPDARRPMALGFKTDEIGHMLTVGEKKKMN